MDAGLPTGVVKFLFTDAEGSTKLVDEYAAALHEHRRILRKAFLTHDGAEVSEATRALVDAPVRDLGQHRLNDLTAVDG